MKNISLIYIIIISLIVGGFLIFSNQSSPQVEGPVSTERNITEPERAVQTEFPGADNAGIYSAYDQAILEDSPEDRKVIFFKASWCPTCTALDNDIKKNIGSIPSDVAILTVDYDTAEQLKEKYDIVVQHTMVQVDSAGNEITKWVGSSTLKDLLSRLQ